MGGAARGGGCEWPRTKKDEKRAERASEQKREIESEWQDGRTTAAGTRWLVDRPRASRRRRRRCGGAENEKPSRFAARRVSHVFSTDAVVYRWETLELDRQVGIHTNDISAFPLYLCRSYWHARFLLFVLFCYVFFFV